MKKSKSKMPQIVAALAVVLALYAWWPKIQEEAMSLAPAATAQAEAQRVESQRKAKALLPIRDKDGRTVGTLHSDGQQWMAVKLTGEAQTVTDAQVELTQENGFYFAQIK